MSQTKADLVREVLGELFSLASGQTPSAEDTTWVEQRIDPTLAALAARNVIYIADSDDIDDAKFDALVAYLTEICGPKFGRPRDLAAKRAAESELRTLQRIGKGTGQNLKTDLMLRAGIRRLGYRTL